MGEAEGRKGETDTAEHRVGGSWLTDQDAAIQRHLLWRLYHITSEINESTRKVEEANEQLTDLRSSSVSQTPVETTHRGADQAGTKRQEAESGQERVCRGVAQGQGARVESQKGRESHRGEGEFGSTSDRMSC